MNCSTRFLSVWLPGAAVSMLMWGANDSTLAPHRANAVLLAFRSNVPAAAQNAILAGAGASVVKRLGSRALMVSVAGNGSIVAALQFLQSHGEILYSEPDYASLPVEGSRGKSLTAPGAATALTGASALTAASTPLPNDPYLVNQWAVQNTGQTGNGTAGADERASQAWGVSTGTNSVVVAVLDSGVQYTHPDLVANVWTNPGGIGGCAAGTHGYNVLTNTCDPMDDDTCYGGHGSHVAGILGAAGNNGAGIAGVNWTTSILPVKWIDSNCAGYTSDLVSAMDWVIQARQAGVNVRIANDSGTWPGTAFSQTLSDEIDLLGTNDILFVTAAGNTAQSNDSVPRYPCSYNRANELCAAATDENDNLWTSSNFGPGVVQLGAPGANIFSTLRSSNYGYISGASMSAAQVSGAAALVLSLQYVPVATLRSTILANVDPLPSLTNKVSSGGRLNVCKALPGCTAAFSATPVNTGLPTIAGTPQYGALLAASTGLWSGIPTTYSYQWYRCNSLGSNCSPLAGARSQAYAMLARADIGVTLSVVVTASNAFGSATAQSIPTGIVASASTPFNITSTIVDGQTIGGTVSWQASPAQTASLLQFYIDGALTQSDSSTPYIYNQGSTNVFDTTTLANGQHVLGLRALSSDNRTYGFYGATVTVTNPPRNTALPVISGSAVQGQVLTSSTGSWTNTPSGYSYRWSRCNTTGSSCAFISGATASNYTVAAADVGSTLRASVTATNSGGSSTAASALTATVTGSVTITTTSLPAGQKSSVYSATLAVAGGVSPYTWSIVSGTLPAGLALAPSTGVISGTPTTAGTSSFTAQVRDGNAQIGTKALSIVITAAAGGIAMVQSTSVQGTRVPSLALAFPAANTAGNLIVAFVRMSSSSQTVSITDSAGNVYADAVSQVQNADGHQVHLFYARNIAGGANTVTATFTATNTHPWMAVYEYRGLSTTNPLDRTAAAQGSDANPTTGPTAATTSSNELIFAGMGFQSNYGGVAAAGASYTLAQQNTATSRAANETALASVTGSYTAALGLSSPATWTAVVATFAATSASAPPGITTSSLPGGQKDSPYSAAVAVAGGVAPYTWSIASGALPAGLTLAPATGVISGTPSAAGTSTFTVQVRDGNSQTDSKTLSIVVAAAGLPIALMQSSSVEGTGLSSISLAFPAANTAGNLIVAFVRMSSSTQTVTIADSAGNTYTDAVSQVQSADGHQVHLLYARNIAGGINTVTATFPASNNHPWLAIYEYSGLSATNPLDRTAAAQGNDSNPIAGPATATTSANELIFAGVGVPSSYGGVLTAGSGFSLAQQDIGTSRAANEASVVSTSASYSAAFNLSTGANWSAVLATFKP